MQKLRNGEWIKVYKEHKKEDRICWMMINKFYISSVYKPRQDEVVCKPVISTTVDTKHLPSQNNIGNSWIIKKLSQFLESLKNIYAPAVKLNLNNHTRGLIPEVKKIILLKI